MEWKKVKLGEIVELHYGKSLVETKRIQGEIPVYSSSGITGWHNEPLSTDKSIIIGRKGNVGSIFKVDIPFFCIDTAYYVSKKVKDIDLDFLYYRLLGLGLEKLNEDSAVPGLNRETAYSQVIFLPPPDEQRRIAGILGAFDDQIEVLRQQNRTLEAMARALFRHWFVDFEFPSDGSGGVPEGQPYRSSGGRMKDSPLGEIPEDWEVVRLDEICSTQYGFTQSSTAEPIGPHFLRVTDINKNPWVNWVDVPYCEISPSDYLKYGLHPGDILVARMADPGKVAFIDKKVFAVFASYLVRLKAESQTDSLYLFYFLNSDEYQEYVEAVKSGAVQQNMNARVMTDKKLVRPSMHILNFFNKNVSIIRQQINLNLDRANSLSQLRDTLLPRLMSGELSTSEQ